MRRLTDAFNRAFTRLHPRVYVATRGWVGHHMTGAIPSLLLHTTGRKTGLARSVALAYSRDGDRYLVVGSNFGTGRSPAWLLNVEADFHVEMNVGHWRMKATAEEVLPGDPRYGRLFDIANAANRDRYRRYATMTSRPIPVVVLVPEDSPGRQ